MRSKTCAFTRAYMSSRKEALPKKDPLIIFLEKAWRENIIFRRSTKIQRRQRESPRSKIQETSFQKPRKNHRARKHKTLQIPWKAFFFLIWEGSPKGNLRRKTKKQVFEKEWQDKEVNKRRGNLAGKQKIQRTQRASPRSKTQDTSFKKPMKNYKPKKHKAL